MPSAVSWRYDYATEPWLRWLVRAGMAAVCGVYVSMLALLAVSLLALFVAGGTGLRLLVVLLTLVGGPVSLLYLLPMLRDPAQRPATFTGRERVIPGREVAACAAVGAVVLGGALVVDPLLAAGLFAAGFAAGAIGVVCSTRGEIDPGSKTGENRYREWDLSRIDGYSTRRIGPLVVVSLDASGPGTFGAVPSRLLVPATVADEATAALDDVVAATDADSGRPPNPAVRAVAVALALCFAAGAVAFVTLAGPLGWHGAAVSVLFAVVFLLIAREG